MSGSWVAWIVVLLLLTGVSRAQDGYTLRQWGSPEVANFDLGERVAILPDLDGDQVRDIAMADPRARVVATGASTGEVRIISGATGLLVRSHQGTAQSLFGWALASVGDLNQDGVQDYAIGAPGSIPGGRVSVFSGATGSLIFNFDGTAPFMCPNPIVCGNFSEALGSSISGTGDLTGDGVPDLVAGCPRFTASANALMTGRVVLISGATGQSVFFVTGTSSWELFGSAVASGNDLDGDGMADVLVGAPSMAGLPYGVPGATAGLVRAVSGATGAPLWGASGIATAEQFGATITFIGDVNSDGRADAAVGSPGILFATGRVTVVSGANGATLATFNGTTAQGRFGAALAAAGDLDADSIPDLLVGEPGAAVASANEVGLVTAYSMATLAPITSWSSGGAGDLSGAGLAGGVSWDADGVPDFVIGLPQADGPGRVDLVSSATSADRRCLGGRGVLSVYPIVGSAAIGDVDVDGVGDFALSHANGELSLLSGATDNTVIARVLGSPSAFSPAIIRVIGLGDINADGIPDFARGNVITSISAELQAISGANLLPLWTQTPSLCGISTVAMVRVADRTGDGVSEVLVGLRQSGCLLPQFGRCELRSGANGALLGTFSSSATGDNLGGAIDEIADLDNDGVSDFVISSSGASQGSVLNLGRVDLVSGASGVVIRSLWGTTPGGFLGIAVAGLGDTNNDGVPDVAASTLATSASPATAWVYSGADGSVIASFPDPGWNNYGRSLAGVGDINADGISDVAIGASYASVNGVTNVGRVLVASGDGSAILLSVAGVAPGGAFGDNLASAMDHDRNGLADILIAGADAQTPAVVRVVSFAGLPDSAQVLGPGCIPLMAAAPSLSCIGGSADFTNGNPAFGFIVSGAAPQVPGLLAIGDPTSWMGFPLPIGLGAIGLGGCSLLVAPDFTLGFTANSAGAWSLPLPIPVLPALANQAVGVQAWLGSFGALPPAGTMTRGVRIQTE